MIEPARPLLFLDIDGVLNRHEPHPNRFCGIAADLMTNFNTVVETVPSVQIVVASAWRYMILDGSMNLTGFANLMQSHGLSRRAAGALVGWLPRDLNREWCNRGRLAHDFMRPHRATARVVAVDDGSWEGHDMGWTKYGFRLVRTGRLEGLNSPKTVELIEALRDEDPIRDWARD